MTEASITDAPAKLAARAQLPRRIILLLVAFGLAWLLIVGLRGLLPEFLREDGGGRLGVVIRELLPASLGLLAASLIFTLIQTAVVTAVAVGIHRLEARAGPLGSALKGLGRLWVFGQAATPAFALAALAVFIFALQLKLVRPVGGGLGNVFLPALALALLPATITAQVLARELTLPREGGGPDWLAALLKGAAALTGQAGGALSALVLVEAVFSWPGLGRGFMRAWMALDAGLGTNVILVLAALTLLGRLASEVFQWLARLRPAPPAAWPEASTPWRKTASRIWLAAALALLLGPVCVGLAGLVTNPDAALESGLADRNEGPSAEHWLGTDSLGRDVLARVTRGGAVTLGLALVIGVLAAIPGGLAGALAGWLGGRRTLQGETLADLLLIPAEAVSLVPAVPLAGLLVVVLGPGEWYGVALAAALALWPRLTHFFRAVWQTGPGPVPAIPMLLVGLGLLLLGAWFAGLTLTSGLDFLGLGLRPPTPTLGGMLAESLATLNVRGGGFLAPGAALGLCALAIYTGASALAGRFPTKEMLARLNE